MTVFAADPDRELDWTVDWTDYLSAIEGSPTIQSAAWSIFPLGPTLGAATNDNTKATTLLSGILAGETYRLTCTMTPTAGQPNDRSLWIRGVER